MSREEFAPHLPLCDPHCISGAQLQAAMEVLGLWFDGNILSVKLGNRGDVQMPGCRSSWYAEVETSSPEDGAEMPYRTHLYRVPVHVGPTMLEAWKEWDRDEP